MNNILKIIIFVVSLMMIGSMFMQTISTTVTTESPSVGIPVNDNLDNTSPADENDEGNVKLIKLTNSEIISLQSESNREVIESSADTITPTEPDSEPMTRTSTRENPDYSDDIYNANELQGPYPESVTGIVTRNDEDWFKIQLSGDDGTGSKVDNLSVMPTSIFSNGWKNPSTNKDTFQIFIFGTYEYGSPFYDKELIFLYAMGYKPWIDWDNEWADCYARAYRMGIYYIMVKGYFHYGNQMDYTLDVNKQSIMPDDFNQVPESGDTSATGKKYKVDQNEDTFDWYKIESPPDKNFRYNFTIDINLDATQSGGDDNSHFGETVHFYTEVIVMLFNDITKAPLAIFKISDAELFGLNGTLLYSENTTEGLKYVGIYVQMYGRDNAESGPYYFVEYGAASSKYHSGYATYNLLISVDYIINPILQDWEVTPYHGRSYMDFTFRLMYTDENNQIPVVHQIQVDDMPIQEMKLVGFNYTDDNYRDGAFYEFTINGVKIGNGWHFYKFIFKDWDGYAHYSSVSFKGPLVTDNIAPQIRDTAEDKITVKEDSGHHYVDLHEIFDDVDHDPLTYKLLQGNNWVTSLETGNASYSIWANDTVRITTKENKYGTELIYINATDSTGDWVNLPFELTVEILPINDPPQILKYLGERSINEDSKLTGLKLSYYFYDPIEPEQTLTFGYEPVDNIEVVLNTESGEVILTPDDNWNGDVSIRFWASDGQDVIYNVLRLKVRPINDLPFFQNPHGLTVNEDEWIHVTLEAYDPIEETEVHIETNLTDEINNKLLVENRVANLETGGVVEGKNFILEKDASENTMTYFSFKPTNEMASKKGSSYSGIYIVNFSAVDEDGGAVFYDIKITVVNTNDPPRPVINRPQNGDGFFLSDRIHFFGDAGDPDIIHGEKNTYKWSSNLEGDLGEEKFLSSMRLTTTGTHTITLEVGDGDILNRTSIEITIYSEDLESAGPSDEPGQILGLSSSESSILLMIIALISLIILFVIAMTISIHTKNAAFRRAKEEPEFDQLKLPDEVQMLLAPQKVVCSNCGSMLSVISKRRPLSVNCNQCGKRSVVFHPGRVAMESGIPGEEELETEDSDKLGGSPKDSDQKLLPAKGESGSD